MVLPAAAFFMFMAMFVADFRMAGSRCSDRAGLRCNCVLCADNTLRLALDLKQGAATDLAGLFKHLSSFEEVFCHNIIFFA